jgi:cytoskeletal protein RodZ
MLELFVKDVLKSPGKLVALCFVVYLAATSFFVGVFLAAAAVYWLRKQLMLKAKALQAAEAEIERQRVDQAREEAVKKAAAANTAQAPSAPTPAPQATPIRQYAKSAVVIPMKKTGTRD